MTTARVIAMLAAAFPTPAWSTDTLRTFEALLRDLDTHALDVAARQWVETHRERPTVADLRAAVAALQAPDALPDPDAWAADWQAITRTLDRYRGGPPADDDPALCRRGLTLSDVGRATIARLGYVALCDAKPGDLGTWRAQFRDVWRAVAARRLRRAAIERGARLPELPAAAARIGRAA